MPSDFENNAVERENSLLHYYTAESNKNQSEQVQERLFMNLSLTEIAQRLSQAIIGIVQDLVMMKAFSLTRVIEILFKGDRMIYLGKHRGVGKRDYYGRRRLDRQKSRPARTF